MRNFNDTLEDLRYGTLLDDLTEKMKEVVTACADTGKVGSLQLTIKMKPGQSGEIEITDQIKATIPELPKSSSIMYVTPEGNLQRTDPRQMTIEGIKVLGRPKREVKQI